MTKKIIAASMTLILLTVSFTACKSEKKKNEDESTNPTVIETVTNEQGEAVTDDSGKAVTEVYEEIPVVDEKGSVVTDENGETVTKKVPATKPAESSSKTNENKPTTTQPIGNGSTTTTAPDGSTTTTRPPSTTNPIKPTVPSTTNPKPSEKPTERPTAPPKPTEPITKPPTTTKPPETTTERSEDIDYFVQYAISYGKSIGLTYLTDVDKENGGWDNPISMKTPVVGDDIEFYEKRITSRLNGIKSEGNMYFWVQTENRNGVANYYNLYIGYYW